MAQARPHCLSELLTLDAHGYGDRAVLFRRLAELLQTDPVPLRERFFAEYPFYFKPEPESAELLRLLRKRSIPFALLTNGGALQ